MNAPHPADVFSCLIKDLQHRLDDATRTINDLTRRVATLEGKPIITPMNPEHIHLDAENHLVCTVGNADYVEFVDIRVNGATWLRFWADWTGQQPPFARNGTTLLFTLPPSVGSVKSVEVFTRYDRHTQTSEAGRGAATF